MRKALLMCLMALAPVPALAEDHDYQMSSVPGGREVLILDSKSGDLWEFKTSAGGTFAGASPLGRPASGPAAGATEETSVRYLGKLRPGQAGDVIIENKSGSKP
jgi:hypothetical protein